MKKRIAAIALAMLCALSAGCTAANPEQPELPEVAVPSAADLSPTDAAETETDPRVITLSGSADDTFVAECDCFAEGEDVVLYFQKGVTIKGDMLEITEKVMDDLCQTTGLTFDKKYSPDFYSDCFDLYFEPGTFADVNQDADKINILIVDLSGEYIQWASENNAILEAADYNYDETFHQTIYHELSHVIQARNGVGLGGMMNEGYASYIADKAMRAQNMPAWNTVQYYFPASYDDSVIALGETGFSHSFDEKDNNYQYGIRFVTFLNDVYGEDSFIRILNEATALGFDEGYYPDDQENSLREDTEQLKTIIKSQTSEDVFDRFAGWYAENWSVRGDEYIAYMESIGQW